MWCQHCGQDVPAVSAAAGVPAACPRCQHTAEAESELHAESVGVEPTDEWRTEQRMRAIGRSLRTPLTIARSPNDDRSMLWVDMPAALHAPKPETSDAQRHAERSRQVRVQRTSERRMQVVAWFALVFGLGLAVGGVGLMGMGMFGEHSVFWRWGVGVTLAGQAILIAGLVKALMSLWGSSRAASRRIAEMQRELAEVGRTAEAIIAQRPGGSSGFYGELARGASPALLLANLKGQIDHLATRLHHDV